jgi:F-type H+-transporting ATPase subunit epsilon
VTADGVILAALTFEFADDIDVERAEKAKDKAELKLAAAADEREANLARARLERALTRLKVAKM